MRAVAAVAGVLVLSYLLTFAASAPLAILLALGK